MVKAITTMLQTTGTNILISSQNITEPQMPQAYDRDLAITGVVCFIGGAGLALLVALACYRALRKKKLKERERRKEEEKEGGAVANHGVRRSGADGSRRDALLQASSNAAPDTRPEGRGGHVWSRSDEDGGYFRCSDCSSKGQRAARPNPMTWNNRINTEVEEKEEKEKRTGWMVGEDERRIPNRPDVSSPVYETDRDLDSYRVNVEGRSTGKETFHCESCHRTYRAQQSTRAGRFKSGVRDPVPPARRWTERGGTSERQDAARTAELGREARSVTFDLEGLVREGEGRTPREKSSKAQSSRPLKVKLNLNPLRKSKVHPRKKNEQERPAERGKRARGKERRGKGKSGGEAKGSPEKVKKASRGRRCSDDGADAKEGDGKAGGETVREQSGDPDGAQSAPTDPAPDSQGGTDQYQGAASSLSAPGRTQTTNLPLLGSAGSQLTGGGLSPQGGNLLLSGVAPGFGAVFPGGPGGSAAPSAATSGPSMGTGGALDSFSRQTGLNLMSPAASLLANSSVHVNPLQATPLYLPPAGGLALNLAAATSEPTFQTQLLPDGVPLPLRLTADPIEALGLQLGEELNKLVPESQAPQITESLAVQVQAADGPPAVSSRAPNTQTEPGHVPGEGAAAEGPDAPASGASGDGADGPVLLHQEYVTEEGDSSPTRKLKLALPEKTSSRPPTALERKIR